MTRRPGPPPREQDGSPRRPDPEPIVAGSGALVLFHGRRLPVPASGLQIGRLADNDIPIADNAVSRHHAEIRPVRGGYWIVDLDSRNGTQLNGERFRGESRWLANGDTVADRRRDAALPHRPGDALRRLGAAAGAARRTVVQFTGRAG